jgi:ketosteroid isomerase-like protein
MADTEEGTVVDALFGALGRGDLAAAERCLTADARVWHSFDQVAQDRKTAVAGWQAFVDMFAERVFVDVRRQATPGGFVQQHLMVVRAGEHRMAWPGCVVLRIEGGLIARLDEYMDRAGSFAPTGEDPTTPGLTG